MQQTHHQGQTARLAFILIRDYVPASIKPVQSEGMQESNLKGHEACLPDVVVQRPRLDGGDRLVLHLRPVAQEPLMGLQERGILRNVSANRLLYSRP